MIGTAFFCSSFCGWLTLIFELQYFSLGYHQCRWNYNSQEDVDAVNRNFDHYDLPMDVMWLDIEHTEGRKYFTWDPYKFSKPLEMISNLTAVGRKLVVIVDPHTKRDDSYFLHNDLKANGYYVKNKEGNDYEGKSIMLICTGLRRLMVQFSERIPL